MWKTLFDGWTIEKGKEIRDSCIAYMDIDDAEIKAQVIGTNNYDVKIDKYLNMSCSCPQGLYLGRCKHLAGVLLKYDEISLECDSVFNFDYSRQEERLTELTEKETAYKEQQSEYWRQRTVEREKEKQERARIREEINTERKKKRAEEARLKKEFRDAVIEEERQRRQEIAKAEEFERRRKLIDKLSLLDIQNLEHYTTEQLKAMRKEMQPQITAKRIENEKARKAQAVATREEQKRIEEEMCRKRWVEEQENIRLRHEAEIKKLESKLTPLIPNEKNEVTIHAGEYLSLFNRPTDLCKKVFGCYCNAVCSSGFFIPMTLLGQYKGKYCVWYTQFGEHTNRYHYGQLWTDFMNKEKDQIIRTYNSNQMDILTSKDKEWSETLLLVFGREGRLYKFFGVFEIEWINDKNPLTITYKKIADSFTYKMKRLLY